MSGTILEIVGDFSKLTSKSSSSDIGVDGVDGIDFLGDFLVEVDALFPLDLREVLTFGSDFFVLRCNGSSSSSSSSIASSGLLSSIVMSKSSSS